ncbi:hypothetical protein NDU88_000932 [Pleurodeles waltl]|uniref:Histidine-rich glycoprotein n=1 Tax=Pleurodeles waltl TaxID=8319 RepID=A0AAV7LBN4_PLEWA|nr:hypothetical protein NDU88_000932 [Pleurodeles waltl]
MKQLTAVLCLALLSLVNAYLIVVPENRPPVVISQDCNATERQAALALDEINKDRDDGFILSLYRVVDAHLQSDGVRDVYFLTIDVLETDCHVLSGKPFKDCHIRPIHRTVFGRCKAVYYTSLLWRKARLFSYSCVLSSVPRELISRMCPDCPVFTRDTDSYKTKAESMVTTYNNESNNTNYFKIDYIERAAMQWVFKAAYFVEFTIQETNCSRLETDVSHCQFLDDEHAHVGFCKGSISEGTEMPDGPPTVSVNCDIYDPKKTGHPHHRHHDHNGKGRHGHGHHGHGKGHRHHHHHHHHPHGQNETHSEDGQHHNKEDHEQKHGHGPPPVEILNHPDQKHHGSSSEEFILPDQTLPPPRKPVSAVKYHQMENTTDFFPDPIIDDRSPPVVLPESSPVGSEGKAAPCMIDEFPEPVPEKFPIDPSDSSGCPAKPKYDLPLIEPLFPVPKQPLIQQ